MKRLFSAVLVLFIVLSLPMAFDAENIAAADKIGETKTKKEIIEEFKNSIQIGGGYADVRSEDSVRLMKENGLDFTFLGFSESNDIEKIKLCEKYGLKIFLSEWDLTMHGDKDLITAPPVEDYQNIVNQEKVSNPSVIGHSLCDEPTAAGMPSVGDSVDRYRSVNSDLIPFVNLYPSVIYSDLEQYDEYLKLYLDETLNDYVSFDIYPLRINNTTQKDYYINLSQVSRFARENNIDYWMYIQSMSYGPAGGLSHRAPSLNDMLFQMYSSLSFGVTKFIHFCYGTPASGVEMFPYGSVDADGNKTELWDITKKANDEIHAIGDAYMKYNHLGAFKVNPSTGKRAPAYVNDWRDTYNDFEAFESIESDYAALVGCFEKKDGEGQAFTLVNASDLSNNTLSTTKFKLNELKKVKAYIGGNPEYLEPDNDGVYTIELESGHGVFVELEEYDKVIILGDADGDGVITMTDALIVLQDEAKIKQMNYYQKIAADIDKDSKITMSDTVSILKYVARLTDELKPDINN